MRHDAPPRGPHWPDDRFPAAYPQEAPYGAEPPPAEAAPYGRASGAWEYAGEGVDLQDEPWPAAPAGDTAYGPEPHQGGTSDEDGYPWQEKKPKRKKRRRVLLAVFFVLILLVSGATFQIVRPLPDPALRLTTASAHTFPGAPPRLPWPAQGQAAVDVEGLGTMGAFGPTTPTPTASVAKVMTAYVFLSDHPLRSGEEGPTFTISPQEAARLPMRISRGESLVEVTAGQKFSQREALEALMIVSANNIAHELARWDSGNLTAFVAKMNATARELGMDSTTYTDPSGYDSRTVSTAADQVKLLRAAMRVPAFAEIVAKQTYVPRNGDTARPGGNILLGRNGFVGGKTGYTDLAGGNYVFAARRRVGGVDALIVGAVLDQPTGNGAMPAMTAAHQLVLAAGGAMTSASLAASGARVGMVDDGLGGGSPLVAATPVTVVGWPGLTVRISAEGIPPRSAAAGHKVGTLIVGATRTDLRLQHRFQPPDVLHRIIRRDPPTR
ncbi:D-alanyl-D-alanine carboxypeptidase [Actinomadura craniellae]|uniref:D-alanyl-D-alanine carboxypeptidase n=2 Tax=Actinomadura craniellae TaxID=2231787 RepID=A0A365HAG6_9ACTN|nr:D-alanyl-D-alanine carboxypeptidase [Actinomadura craniellae]